MSINATVKPTGFAHAMYLKAQEDEARRSARLQSVMVDPLQLEPLMELRGLNREEAIRAILNEELDRVEPILRSRRLAGLQRPVR